MGRKLLVILSLYRFSGALATRLLDPLMPPWLDCATALSQCRS